MRGTNLYFVFFLAESQRGALNVTILKCKMALVKISQNELTLGRLRFPIFSVSGKLLLNEGFLLQSETLLERLLLVGAFRFADDALQGNLKLSADSITTLANHENEPVPETSVHLSKRFPIIGRGPEAFRITRRGEQNSAINAVYVGVVTDKSVIVAVPTETTLSIGADVDVNLLHGRNIYSFGTRVSLRTGAPFDVIFLEYPSLVKEHTLRRNLRVEVRFPARLLRNDSVAAGFDSMVTNLSLSGIGISMVGATLEKNEHFKLSVKLTLSNRCFPLMLNCIVRNTRLVSEAWLIGAEFGALQNDVRGLLKDYVFEAATGGVP